jgi:hypothetical protein
MLERLVHLAVAICATAACSTRMADERPAVDSDLTAAGDSDPTARAASRLAGPRGRRERRRPGPSVLDALESVFRMEGGERAEFILSALDRKAKDLGVVPDVLPFGPYRNTIPLEKQGAFPGDIEMETRITAIIRWNALAMVIRANAAYGDLGGHVASYTSAAEIFEVGFNHSFCGAEGEQGGDVIFFQPQVKYKTALPIDGLIDRN